MYAKYHHNFKSLPRGKRISHGHWRSCGYYYALLIDYFTVLHFYQVDHRIWKVASILLFLWKLYPRFIHYLDLKRFKHNSNSYKSYKISVYYIVWKPRYFAQPILVLLVCGQSYSQWLKLEKIYKSFLMHAALVDVM